MSQQSQHPDGTILSQRSLPSGVRSLEEIMRSPEAVAPPRATIPGVAWLGRATLLAAREKEGKSTFAAAAAAALSAGQEFLGGQCQPGDVMWVGCEEALSDVARRFVQFGADPSRIAIVEHPCDTLERVISDIALIRPRFLVVDGVTALAEATGSNPQSASALAWTAFLRQLIQTIRQLNIALLLLHHATKKTGHYRDSTAIGAAVDVIMEASVCDSDASVRAITARARWPVSDFRVRLRENHRYELVGPPKSLAEQIVEFVASTPGASLTSIRAAVRGRNEEIDAVLAGLVGVALRLEVRGNRHYYYCV
jgi:hypothetical protein